MNNRQKLGYMGLGTMIVIGLGVFLGCGNKGQSESIVAGIDLTPAVDKGEGGE